jgi:glycosyltransferase involved in cell wall biosynthesis
VLGFDKKSITALPAMSGKPKVSIVTACRNAAGTLEETILSVINQDYEDIEYIIVDADSNDETADIIEKYRQRITLWIREPDKGIADAWNKGIRRASGDIIGIINADDFYMPGAISLAVDMFIENQGCGFVYGDLRLVNFAKDFERIERGCLDYRTIIRYDMLNLPHPTMFVRTDVYNQIGLFSLNYRIAMDYEFVRRMASRGVEGRRIPRVLAVMREGGLSETDRITASREVMKISTTYGFNRVLALGYFLFKCTRTYTGKAIEHFGGDMATLRKLRNSARAMTIFRRSQGQRENSKVRQKV